MQPFSVTSVDKGLKTSMNGNGFHNFVNNSKNELESHQTTSFIESLEHVVIKRNKKVYATWFDDNGKGVQSYTYEGIWEEAGYIAHKLRNDWNLNKGDRIILCYDFGLQFFAAFLGCLRAGVTSVLVYPPAPANLKKALPKLAKITADCEAKFILVDSNVNFLRKVSSLKSRQSWPKIEYKLHPSRNGKLSSMYKKKKPKDFNDVTISPDDIAFLQYTSGSTGDPKVSAFFVFFLQHSSKFSCS